MAQDFNNQAGIYKIHCKDNGRTYIGSTNNLARRLKEHKRDLREGTHSNTYLQNSYFKYGEDSLSFSVITICSESERFKLEQFYIHITDNLFNQILEVQDLSHKKRFTSEQTLKRMSVAQGKRVWTDRHKKISTETLNNNRHLALLAIYHKVIVVTAEGIQEYPSVSEVCRIFGVDKKTIKKKIEGTAVPKSKKARLIIQIYHATE